MYTIFNRQLAYTQALSVLSGHTQPSTVTKIADPYSSQFMHAYTYNNHTIV